jgi:hypothetical protein
MTGEADIVNLHLDGSGSIERMEEVLFHIPKYLLFEYTDLRVSSFLFPRALADVRQIAPGG